MQKVHGPALQPPAHARHGYFDHPGALTVGLALLLILYAIVYFGFFGA